MKCIYLYQLVLCVVMVVGCDIDRNIQRDPKNATDERGSGNNGDNDNNQHGGGPLHQTNIPFVKADGSPPLDKAGTNPVEPTPMPDPNEQEPNQLDENTKRLLSAESRLSNAKIKLTKLFSDWGKKEDITEKAQTIKNIVKQLKKDKLTTEDVDKAIVSLRVYISKYTNEINKEILIGYSKKLSFPFFHIDNEENNEEIRLFLLNKIDQFNALKQNLTDNNYKEKVDETIESINNFYWELAPLQSKNYSETIINIAKYLKDNFPNSTTHYDEFEKIIHKQSGELEPKFNSTTRAVREVSESWLKDYEAVLKEIDNAEKELKIAQTELYDLNK